MSLADFLRQRRRPLRGVALWFDQHPNVAAEVAAAWTAGRFRDIHVWLVQAHGFPYGYTAVYTYMQQRRTHEPD